MRQLDGRIPFGELVSDGDVVSAPGEVGVTPKILLIAPPNFLRPSFGEVIMNDALPRS